MVSFPSCHYIRVVGVVRVKTILLVFGKATIIEDVGRRPFSIVLGSIHSKNFEDGCMVITAKTFFFEFFLLNQAPHTLQKRNCKH